MTAPGEDPPRHLVLLGPTASGKSGLAHEVALRREGVELVSVDSMSVYRGLDIGTAKPSREMRSEVRYHLLDLVGPSEEFTLRRFQDAARAALRGVEARGNRALLVAGTALYLRAVVDDLELPGRWPDLAGALEREAEAEGGTERLHARLDMLDHRAAARIEPLNRRRVVRALEVTLGSGRPFSSYGPGLDLHPPTRFVLVGIPFDAASCDARIEERFENMVDAGLVDEVRSVAEGPESFSRTARQALGYREILSHLEDGVPLDAAVREAVRRTRAFARRQWRWFRRDPRVVWLDPAHDLLPQLLSLWDATSRCPVGE